MQGQAGSATFREVHWDRCGRPSRPVPRWRDRGAVARRAPAPRQWSPPPPAGAAAGCRPAMPDQARALPWPDRHPGCRAYRERARHAAKDVPLGIHRGHEFEGAVRREIRAQRARYDNDDLDAERRFVRRELGEFQLERPAPSSPMNSRCYMHPPASFGSEQAPLCDRLLH